MKWFVSLLAITVVSSCDPAYHLSYAVVNDSHRTIYCVDSSGKGAETPKAIAPDSALEVYYEIGFGSGREQFKGSRSEVASRFIFYADSTLSDSVRIEPRKGWKYYPLPIGDYNARVYIRDKDLK